ncbi:UvrB/UvrC motif-containing protein [Candidatus Kaiserbacteria bacterium]|nr:UvrB/UvrC motif-containing protein [Candidatus Kaiserbacteria bacterium]
MKREDIKKIKLPDSAGVYLFKKGRKILYIGKAASLKDRVRSYFATDLVQGRGTRIVGMVAEATSVSWQKTDSVLEALMLEANLIKHHQPPYNVDQKDNKSWNYVVITKEDFPRVLVVRGRGLFQNYGFRKPLHISGLRNPYIVGPYPHGGQLREAVRMVRRIFPFRDKCTPRVGKSCFNRQIGLCPGVCTGEISKEEYARTIRSICELFSGNFKGLKRRLAREMKAAATREDFEQAESFRRQISALEHVRDVSLIKDEFRHSYGGPSTSLRASGTRIEAFDVAHMAGEETVGVMTVVDNGEPYKAAYRKFNVRTATNDDVAALKEILSRRLNHTEWPLPRVFVVDGGRAQVCAAERILEKVGVMIPVIGVVKNEFHRPERLIGDERAIQAFERDILLANSEAHRFAVAYHRKKRQQRSIQ